MDFSTIAEVMDKLNSDAMWLDADMITQGYGSWGKGSGQLTSGWEQLYYDALPGNPGVWDGETGHARGWVKFYEKHRPGTSGMPMKLLVNALVAFEKKLNQAWDRFKYEGGKPNLPRPSQTVTGYPAPGTPPPVVKPPPPGTPGRPEVPKPPGAEKKSDIGYGTIAIIVGSLAGLYLLATKGSAVKKLSNGR